MFIVSIKYVFNKNPMCYGVFSNKLEANAYADKVAKQMEVKFHMDFYTPADRWYEADYVDDRSANYQEIIKVLPILPIK